MKAPVRIFTRVLKMGTLMSTLALVVTVLLQIFARFFLASAPSWTEEASRLFFIYAISFAAGLAYKGRYYVHLDLIFDRLSARGQAFVKVLIAGMSLFLFLVMGIFTLPLIRLGLGETSPSMGIDMSVAFFSMLVLAVPIVLYTWLDLRKAFQQLRS
jgi:TRAP-type transport system small permease protein